MSCVYILIYKRRLFLSILLLNVICIEFNQLVDHCVTSICNGQCGGGKAITPPFSTVIRTVDEKEMR